MDKKKLKTWLDKAKKHICRHEWQKALFEVNSAIKELSKPDWISVEEDLPPIGMRVLVCNIKNPDIVVSDYRSEVHNCKVNDGYGFLIGNHVTHWHKIDKLEV